MFTVGMIFNGFNFEINHLSSSKLECSLYGIPYNVTAPLTVGFRLSSDVILPENVQPVGLNANT